MTRSPTILLTEDESLIGLDLFDILTDAGYVVIGPATTVAESFRLLEQQVPDIALIDLVLRDGSCAAFTRELKHRGVPFVIHTGLPDDRQAMSAFPEAVWLTKPASPEDVLDALQTVGGGTAP